MTPPPLSVKNFFLMSILNFPWHSLRPWCTDASVSGCMNASMSVSWALNMGSDDSQVVTISHVFHNCMVTFHSYNLSPSTQSGGKSVWSSTFLNRFLFCWLICSQMLWDWTSLARRPGELESELEMYLLWSQRLMASFCRATRSDQQDLLVPVSVDVHNNFFIRIVVEEVDRRWSNAVQKQLNLNSGYNLHTV